MRREVKRQEEIPACRRAMSLVLVSVLSMGVLFGTYALQAASSGEEAPVAEIRPGGPVPSSPTPPEPVPVVTEGSIKKGETISSLLGEWLTPKEILLLARQSKAVFWVRKIREGHPYLVRTLDGEFDSFEYEIDSEEKLVVRAEGDGFVLAREPIVYQTETVIICGNITTSLFEAAGQMGEAPVLVMRLVEIFGWDVDFALDVRQGDTFKAIVEKRYRHGAFAGYGEIPAAEFVNKGLTYQAFLFENRDGHPEYYDAKGRSLRRAFLKTPLDYARVTSGFSWNRFHPIKKEWGPHPAVDYAAPVGTPVRTVGDGVVVEAGRKKDSGKYVKIRHNSMYQTYYLHLSRFAKGISHGKRVRQGQVIGYVGSTGMSTGPHLDFRMKKNGKYVNPRRIIAPASPPVPRERIEEFRNIIQPLLAHLDATTVPVAMETSGKLPESHEDKKDRRQEDRSMQDARGGL